MKVIITISTLIFVTLSFIGIASYYRYNTSLRERGLYAPEKPVEQTTTVNESNDPGAIPEADIQQQQQESPQPVAQQTKPKQTTKNNAVKQAQPKTENLHPVLASKKKPAREIDFESFSRAPMREPREIEPVEVREVAETNEDINNETPEKPAPEDAK